MARQTLTAQQIVRSGLEPVLSAPNSDGDIVPTGQVALRVDNAGSSALTVTVRAAGVIDGQQLRDLTVSIPAGKTRLIGPFPPRSFRQPSTASVGAGAVLVDYSAVTGVSRAVITF